MDVEISLSPVQIWKYDVFLSFHTGDTGRSFTCHLLAALKRKGILTFTCDKKINAVSPEILKAISESQISIVVLSKNYAASSFCLDELAKIMECHSDEEQRQPVFPVYFDVDPYEVRGLVRGYGKVFAKLEERFRGETEKLQKWKMALTDVVSVSGWWIQHQLEAEVIDSIVKKTINVLSHKCLGVAVADDLVGIESRVKALDKFLNKGSTGVQFVGICGMEGTGKTTLASILYHRIFPQFEACCFLSNVSEFSKSDGLIVLQEQLLSATLEWKDIEICNVYEGSVWIRRTLEYRKTLLVLDYVDDIEQLETLARNHDWFGPGSVIIITTRDENILNRFGVDKIYKIESLNEDEALKLFCRSAFKCDYPKEGFEELTCSVLDYAKGLPLAIKSLGLFLLDRSVSEWKSVLAKLQMISNHSMMKVRRQGFDGSSNDFENELLLDITRFFVGEKINYVEETSSGHHKSLIKSSDQRNHKHDVLREIFQHESPVEPRMKSKFWLYDDFRHVMDTNTEITDIEAIFLNQEDLEEPPLSAKAFLKMINLRLIFIRNVQFSGNLEYLSDELIYISWHKYSFTSLPPGFEPHGLVELIMPESSITQLWEGIKMLPKLRNINLRGSKNLIKTPDFSGILNLETLDLEECVGLLQLHPSIATLPKLTLLNLKNCTSLVSIPNNLSALTSLKFLNLDGCSIQVKLLANQHCPFLVKILCYIFILFLKGMMNSWFFVVMFAPFTVFYHSVMTVMNIIRWLVR